MSNDFQDGQPRTHIITSNMDDVLGNEHNDDIFTNDIPNVEQELQSIHDAEFANLPDIQEELQRRHDAEVAIPPDMHEGLQPRNTTAEQRKAEYEREKRKTKTTSGLTLNESIGLA